MTRSIAEDFNLYAPLDCNGASCPVCCDWDHCPTRDTLLDFKVPDGCTAEEEAAEEEAPYATLAVEEYLELGGEG